MKATLANFANYMLVHVMKGVQFATDPIAMTVNSVRQTTIETRVTQAQMEFAFVIQIW